MDVRRIARGDRIKTSLIERKMRRGLLFLRHYSWSGAAAATVPVIGELIEIERERIASRVSRAIGPYPTITVRS